MRDIILYIGSIFLPDKSAGAQRALSLSKSFRDLGYKTVIAGMSAEQDQNTPILDTKSNCMGFDSFSVPQPKSFFQWFHHTVSIKEFKEIINYFGADRIFAIVAMEYEAIPLWRLSRYCRREGIYLIADAEEWYEHSRLPFPLNAGKDLDTFLRMRFVYPKKIKNMICISRFFEKYYANMVKNIVYIPGTIDLSQDKWNQLPQYVPTNKLKVGYAGHPGRHFEKERLDWLINAIVELNDEGTDCELHIAGVDMQFLEDRIGKLHNKEKIICYGKVSHLQCLQMLAMCDFSAIVRENKRVTKAGFPTKFSESLGCGTPVITTATSNLSEYIHDKKTGFLCKGYSKNDLKAVIKKAASIPKQDLVQIHTNLRSNNPLVYSDFTLDLEKFLGKLEL